MPGVGTRAIRLASALSSRSHGLGRARATPGGRLLRPDFLFRAQGVAVEIEGYAYHGRREDHRRDIARFNDLQQCAEVRIALRFTAEQVFHSPTTMIDTVRRTLDTADRRWP